MHSGAPAVETAFQVYHRHLLLLLDDAKQQLPDSQWRVLCEIVAQKVGEASG